MSYKYIVLQTLTNIAMKKGKTNNKINEICYKITILSTLGGLRNNLEICSVKKIVIIN